MCATGGWAGIRMDLAATFFFPVECFAATCVLVLAFAFGLACADFFRTFWCAACVFAACAGSAAIREPRESRTASSQAAGRAGTSNVMSLSVTSYGEKFRRQHRKINGVADRGP